MSRMGDLLAKYKKVNRKKKDVVQKDGLSRKNQQVDNIVRNNNMKSIETMSPFCACLQQIWIESKLKSKSQVLNAMEDLKEETESDISEIANKTTTTIATTTKSCNKLAVLFLIIDDFPHEAIWRTWLNKTNSYDADNSTSSSSLSSSTRVKIYIHAKYPEKVTSPWVRQHLLKHSFKPNWGSVEITKAMISLLRQAIQEDAFKQILKFIFASESCVPLKSLDESLKAIFTNDKSWIGYRDKPNNGYSQQLQFGILQNKIPKQCIIKSDQWVLLNRSHVEDLLSLPSKIHKIYPIEINNNHHNKNKTPFTVTDLEYPGEDQKLFSLFSKVGASDEMYIPTCLSILGHLDTSSTEDAINAAALSNEDLDLIKSQNTTTTIDNTNTIPTLSDTIDYRKSTYVDWSENAKNPRTFYSLEKQGKLWNNAIADGAILFRKVKIDPHQNQQGTNLSSSYSHHMKLFEEWAILVYPEDEINDVVLKAKSYFKMNSACEQEKVNDDDDKEMNQSLKRFRKT